MKSCLGDIAKKKKKKKSKNSMKNLAWKLAPGTF